MNERDNILNELKELSATVADIPKLNVFTIPAGYFDTLGGDILLRVYNEKRAVISPINDTSVPAGYFENLAETIMSRIKNETLTESVIETTAMSELVAGIGNKNIYNIPQGYFEHLSDNITQKINNQISSNPLAETYAISQLVAGIGNKNVYTVPQGYFEGLAKQLNIQTPVAKVVSMNNRFPAIKYAMAAAVTGFMAFSMFIMLNKNEIKPGAQTAAVMKDAKDIIKTNSFDKELNSIPDDAIVAFLESKGQNVEAALLASLDEKNLPDADEYLVNDNTLDEILNTLDLNN
ncbi:MAG TPA: hypothetical protein VLR49_13090 [Ferruginibacter sp.]|nr:hypothetical protein [Ferruginibacter sp.]